LDGVSSSLKSGSLSEGSVDEERLGARPRLRPVGVRDALLDGEAACHVAARGVHLAQAVGVLFDAPKLELDAVGGGLAKVLGYVWGKHVSYM
jgi:hypothetical protein